MKHRFTFFKLLTLSLLISVCTTAFGQGSGTYFKNFSEPDEIGAWASGGGTQVDGHYVNTSAAGTRADNHYNTAAIGSADAPEVQANYISLIPSTDVYWAIKFLGTPPPIGEKSQWLHKLATSPDEPGWTAKVAPAGSSVTAAGNTVYYWDFSSLLGDGYTGDDEYYILRQSYVITLGAQVGYTIDWVGSFTTLDDIETTAASQDDGVDDDDESVVNARLSEITVNGDPIFAFDPFSFTYNFILPLGTVDLPTVGGTADEVSSTIALTQATTLPGAATIVVTAADADATEETYTINFTVRQEEGEQFFLSLSDTTQNKEVGISSSGSSPVFENGHVTSVTTGTRADFEYGFNDGTDSSFSINPYRDKYFAVKVVGSVPSQVEIAAAEHNVQFYFDGIASTAIKGGTQLGSSVSVSNFPIDLYTTPRGNDVLIIELQGLSDFWDEWATLAEAGVTGGDHTSEYDLYVNRLEMKWIDASDIFTMSLDWAGFFTSIDDIELAAITKDDGDYDEDDATSTILSDITVNGTRLDGFDSLILAYDVELPLGTTDIPAVVATAWSDDATVDVTQASALPGNASIVVTGSDLGEAVTQTYTINFTVAAALSDDATLSDLTIDGTTIASFDAATLSYDEVLDFGTTVVPTVTATANFSVATAVVTQAASLPGSTTILVTAQDESTQTYTINFTVAEPSTDATLSDLTIDGTTVASFDAATTAYTVELSNGTTVVPTVAATTTDANAAAVITEATALPGSTTIEVTAEDGTTIVTYTIEFTVTPLAVDISNVEISIYPNPTSSVVHFSGLRNETYLKAQITDLSGVSFDMPIINNQIDVADLKSGVYFIKIADLETIRFIKQ